MATNKKRSAQNRRVGSMLDDALFYDERISKLSKEAFILFIEALMMENSYNNGNIALADGTLRFGWRKQTLVKARKQLVELELIELQKHGIFGNPNLYSLCHKPICENKRLGINGTTKAKRRATGIHPKIRNRGTEVQPLRGAQV
jgi:hypothetical protein